MDEIWQYSAEEQTLSDRQIKNYAEKDNDQLARPSVISTTQHSFEIDLKSECKDLYS